MPGNAYSRQVASTNVYSLTMTSLIGYYTTFVIKFVMLLPNLVTMFMDMISQQNLITA